MSRSLSISGMCYMDQVRKEYNGVGKRGMGEEKIVVSKRVERCAG